MIKPKSGEDDLDISAYLDEALWTNEMDDMLQVDKSANTHFDAEIDDVSQVHKITKIQFHAQMDGVSQVDESTEQIADNAFV